MEDKCIVNNRSVRMYYAVIELPKYVWGLGESE